MFIPLNEIQRTVSAAPEYPYDAAALFGSAIDTTTGKFPQFVYDEIDAGVEILAQDLAPNLIFCGSHPGTKGLLDNDSWNQEYNIADRDMLLRHPEYYGRFLRECKSTSIPENWLRMKMAFPSFRRLLVVVIEPLFDRNEYNADMVYGDDGEITFKVIPGPPGKFLDEPWQLEKTKCILERQRIPMERGKHDFLLEEDGHTSRWPELREAHRNHCLHIDGPHQSPDFSPQPHP